MTLTLVDTNGIKFQAKGEKAEIVMYGDIGWDVTAKGFSDELKALGDVAEIDIRINSFGGDVFDGVAIFNRLDTHKAKKTVYVDGIAASAASVIAMAGDEIHIAESGFIMIHDAWTVSMGNAKELRATADRLEAVSAQIAGIYQRRTGAEMDQIREWMDTETEFNSADSVQFGFATAIYEGKRMAAKFDPERHHFKHKPAAAMTPNRAEAERLVAELRMQSIR